ncbi:MAG: VWA domain-containing protein [Bacteroidetes bacterium]|nr:MAG: VWA domain-containing protein [Bacteroidota bacterium]
MKWFSWLTLLPFTLAVLFAVKIYWDKFQRTDTHRPVETVVTPFNDSFVPDGRRHIQVALLLDISGSMDGLIEQAKTQLWQMVNELSLAKYGQETPDLEIALYAYGGDKLDASRGYVQQLVPLSRDLDRISEALFALETSGGEEYCGKAIEWAVAELAWSPVPEDLRLIFIAGNEPFSQGPVLYREACAAARQRQILVNTIFCGDYREGIDSQWSDGAQAGGGQYMHIDHNQEMAQVETPFDDRIVALNDALNKTYVAYGASGQQRLNRQQTQDQNAAQSGSLTTRGLAKSKRAYDNREWDLVDATRTGTVDLEKIDMRYLADSLQGYSLSQLERFLANQRQAREHIQSEMRQLEAERKTYLRQAAQIEAEGQALDEVLVQTIRKQAQERHYDFD